ncbi:MAG TPA: hypothetical protein VHU81_01715 [Thermoanaerobaculia bacterium]|nr:hypothetical protein [Thermoanaerobaculia bacterium]
MKTTRRSVPLAVLLAFALAGPALLQAQTAPSRWRQLGPELVGPGNVLALAFDPGRPDRVFAGLDGGGVARSGDGGRTWRAFGEGLVTAQVTSVVVHPAASGRVYAISSEFFLHRSDNDGRTWSPLPLTEAHTVVPERRDPQGVWATARGGLYRSQDGGDSWQRLQANLPAVYGAGALAVSPVDPRRLYLGVTGASGFGFWVSEDGGRSWTRRSRSVPSLLYADVQDARTVYFVRNHQVQRSRDAGRTWQPFFGDASSQGGAVLGLAQDPREPTVFFVLSSAYGLFRTTDAGRHWVEANAGLPAQHDLKSLAVADAGTLLTGGRFEEGHFRVYRSDDAGETWEPSARGLVSTAVSAVTATRTGALFTAVYFDGLLRSLDQGATWTRSLDVGFTFVQAFALDPVDAATVYAGTTFSFGEDPHFLWKTTDGGDSWQPLPYPTAFEGGQIVALDVDDIAVDPADPSTVFLATVLNNAGRSSSAGLFRSRDGGQTWEKVGLPNPYFDVKTHPAAPGMVLALSPFGVFRSADHGDTWTAVLARGAAEPLFSTLALAPSDPAVAYALRTDGMLFRSLDAGATWASLGKRLPASLGRRALVVDPRDPATIVFQGDAGPVRLTLGAGRAGRTLLGRGLIGRDVTVLSFDPDDPLRLLAGIGGAGLMEYRFQP